MAARDAVKQAPAIARNHCPNPAKCAGGTDIHDMTAQDFKGLSPRVRGNRDRLAPARQGIGSIPAGAGEPRTTPRRAGNSRVYPRGCGGTFREVFADEVGGGLSPRVRGNPIDARRGIADAGSIPAGAGGTGVRPPKAFRFQGLSPRVRGNPTICRCSCVSSGSILAGAGEPIGCATSSARVKVYPRGCEGT